MPDLNQSDAEIIRQFLEGLIPDVVKSQETHGLRASGKSAELMSVLLISDKIGQLIDGSGSFYFQQGGRGPTLAEKSSGDKTLQELIYDWLEFKKYGLNYKNDKERESLSWGIATKIHREGTHTHITGKPINFLSDVITDKRTKALSEVFADKYAAILRSDIVEAFKSIAA